MADIGDRTRRLLWGPVARCAFPDCGRRLIEPTRDGGDHTNVGVECHIVAQRDSKHVARSPSLLSPAERQTYENLIEDRHGFDNLVLMCAIHAKVIDQVSGGYSVAEVIEMKRARLENDEEDQRHLALGGGVAGLAPTAAQLIALEDIPAWERKAIKKLTETEPSGWDWLCSRVGHPADHNRVAVLIAEWPERLALGSFELCHAVVRQAERGGRWTEAADVWERLGRREDNPRRADHLVRAAIDAKLAGNTERYADLLNDAESVDPKSPRLRVVRLDETEGERSASAQLQALEELESDDPSLASAISIQRSYAALLIPDWDLAQAHLEEAASLDADSHGVRSMRAIMCVRRAAVARFEGDDFSIDETVKAGHDAFALRAELLDMGRWEQSARLLTVAASVPGLLGDLAGAREILQRARPEELAAVDGARALGDQALYLTAPELALSLTSNAEQTDAIRRIRASATILEGRADPASLAELRSLALAKGAESQTAAIACLAASGPPVKAAWDEEVAEVVEGAAGERLVAQTQVAHLLATDQLEAAENLVGELPDTIWAAELQLEVADSRGTASGLRAAASKLLSLGPGAASRLHAAGAFGGAGDLEKAGELAAAIAHSVNAPAIVRSNAFEALMRSLAGRDLWEQASDEFEKWQQFARQHLPRPDPRLSAWEVRIASHRPKRS